MFNKIFLTLLLVFAYSIQVFAKLPIQAKGQNITIHKDALGIKNEFLIKSSLIPQDVAATSHGLAARVVYFEKRGDRVFIMEASNGLTVTDELPAKFILTEIPVISETETHITLDFNRGMEKVFLSPAWYGTDMDGGEQDKGYNDFYRSFAAPVSNSFIESITKNESQDALELRHIVQLRVNDGMLYLNYEVRYNIEKYKPNPNYQPKETSRFKQVGFFEVLPRLEKVTGASTVKITKWDISKPIIYHISSNTPKELIPAVSEGILYWNRFFGKEVLKVEVAPEGVTAPDFRYNLVQWVPYQSAGFAYADALSDPNTGEILNAQIYMTSVFEYIAKVRARRLIRNTKDQLSEKESLKTKNGKPDENLFSKFLQSKRLCTMDLTTQMQDTVVSLIDSGADDATIFKVAYDYVRIVVAHEVGHTLGLRHNFMGHYASNVSLLKRDEAFKDYLMNNIVPDATKFKLSSSVMDYLVFKDDLLASAQMGNVGKNGASEAVFEYDALAIKWAYLDNKDESEYDRVKSPIFGTDSLIGTCEDCKTFESGNSPMAFHLDAVAQSFKLLSANILDMFIAAKAPLSAQDKIPLDEVALDPREFAAGKDVAGCCGHHVIHIPGVVDHYVSMLKWFDHKTRSAFIEKRLPFANSLNEDLINERKLKWVEAQIADLGGVEQAFFSLLPIKMEWEKATKPKGISFVEQPFSEKALKEYSHALSELVKKPFVGLDGKQYSFSEDEKTIILKRAEEFFHSLESEFINALLDVFLKAKIDLEYKVLHHIAEDGISAKLEKRLLEVADAVLFAETTQNLIGKIEYNETSSPNIVVKAFKYRYEIREKAAKLLSYKLGTDIDWSMSSRKNIAEKLMKKVSSELGLNILDLDVAQVKRPLNKWVVEQKNILNILFSEPGCEKLLLKKDKKGKKGGGKGDDEGDGEEGDEGGKGRK